MTSNRAMTAMCLMLPGNRDPLFFVILNPLKTVELPLVTLCITEETVGRLHPVSYYMANVGIRLLFALFQDLKVLPIPGPDGNKIVLSEMEFPGDLLDLVILH